MEDNTSLKGLIELYAMRNRGRTFRMELLKCLQGWISLIIIPY
jgi:hypothetical protein